jgi:uncharacterized protein (TIGR02246 family)
MQRSILVALVLLMAMACHQFVSPYQKDRERVKELVDTFIAANNHSDLAGMLSLYEQDAELMPPNRLSISGKAAIEGNYRQLFANSKINITTTVKDITVGDLWAVVSGSNTGTAFQIKDSSTLHIYDKYMMLLQKRQTGWMIKRLIWNTDVTRNIIGVNRNGDTTKVVE